MQENVNEAEQTNESEPSKVSGYHADAVARLNNLLYSVNGKAPSIAEQKAVNDFVTAITNCAIVKIQSIPG